MSDFIKRICKIRVQSGIGTPVFGEGSAEELLEGLRSGNFLLPVPATGQVATPHDSNTTVRRVDQKGSRHPNRSASHLKSKYEIRANVKPI